MDRDMSHRTIVSLIAVLVFCCLSSCARGIPAASESSYARGYTDAMKYYISQRGEAQGMLLFDQALSDLAYRRGVQEAFSQFVEMQEFAKIENEEIYNEIIVTVDEILKSSDYMPNAQQMEQLKFWLDARPRSEAD